MRLPFRSVWKGLDLRIPNGTLNSWDNFFEVFNAAFEEVRVPGFQIGHWRALIAVSKCSMPHLKRSGSPDSKWVIGQLIQPFWSVQCRILTGLKCLMPHLKKSGSPDSKGSLNSWYGIFEVFSATFTVVRVSLVQMGHWIADMAFLKCSMPHLKMSGSLDSKWVIE